VKRLAVACFGLSTVVTVCLGEASGAELEARPPVTPASSAPNGAARLHATIEVGALDPLYHRIQFGRDGTEFDYVRDGGQDVLFPFSRLDMRLDLGRHRVALLYQPLELTSKVTLSEPVTVDGLTFAAGTPLDLEYGFPFYRASYLYTVVQAPDFELALGAGLQIRDATITFTSGDGAQRRSNRDVGPVPLLQTMLRWAVAEGLVVGADVAGFYAPVKYLNGGDSDVVGAIIDASAFTGYQLSPRLFAFLNLRWLGGGAEGTSEAESFGDGFSSNWLHFATVSVGVQVELL
jgi:hypothetical protein